MNEILIKLETRRRWASPKKRSQGAGPRSRMATRESSRGTSRRCIGASSLCSVLVAIVKRLAHGRTLFPVTVDLHKRATVYTRAEGCKESGKRGETRGQNHADPSRASSRTHFMSKPMLSSVSGSSRSVINLRPVVGARSRPGHPRLQTESPSERRINFWRKEREEIRGRVSPWNSSMEDSASPFVRGKGNARGCFRVVHLRR